MLLVNRIYVDYCNGIIFFMKGLFEDMWLYIKNNLVYGRLKEIGSF